jgi:hypothetical protein
MNDLRSISDGQKNEISSLKRTIRILIVVILILIALSLTLGYCSYSCINEPACPLGTPTGTPLPMMTLPPQNTITPTITSEGTLTVTPTITHTPTPNLNATATAACSKFMDQFPGTPCP